MNKKFFIKTWGCQMNEYDSSKIIDILNADGSYQLTNSVEEADILLLNTCSIREKAQEKLFHQLGRWKYLKIKKENIIIAVGGCVASQEGEYILQRADYVDIIFGPQTLHRLPNMIKDVYENNSTIIDISFPDLEKFNYTSKLPFKNKGPTAYVTIMEGCNKYCNYCIVPFTRGQEINRSCEDILFEIFNLSKNGVKEVNLLGQNVNAWRGIDKNGKIDSFANLLRKISEIDGIDRIRFTTNHPIEFTDDIIEVYRDNPKLVNFLHLPIQSGSNRILNLMGRNYTVEEYKIIVQKLRKIRPNMHISSDFIIGFPGETIEDFECTMKIISEINFDMSYSFIFSARPGTPAANIADYSMSEEQKKQCLYSLQKKIKIQAMAWSRRMLGTTQKILVEGVSKRNVMELYGRTENNRIVNFEGSLDIIGKLIEIKIIDILPNSLRGKILC